MSFATNDSEKMRILDTGEVGIGTAVPGTKLTVLDTTAAYQVQITSGGTAWQLGVGNAGYYQNSFLIQDSTVGDRLRIVSNAIVTSLGSSLASSNKTVHSIMLTWGTIN